MTWITNHLPIRRKRVSVELAAHVVEVSRDGDTTPLYRAVVTNAATGAILWQSAPLPAYGAADFLGWRHMALLALSLQEHDEPEPGFLD